MASSEDFKRVLELYKQESKASGVSIVTFCQKNGIVYSQFERWYKNRHLVKIHAVDIVDKDGVSQVTETDSQSCVTPQWTTAPHDVLPSESVMFTNTLYVFSKLIEGEKDYEKLLPSAVAL